MKNLTESYTFTTYCPDINTQFCFSVHSKATVARNGDGVAQQLNIAWTTPMSRRPAQLTVFLNLQLFLLMLANVAMVTRERACVLKSLTVVQSGDTVARERIIATLLGQSRLTLQMILMKQKSLLAHVVEEVLAMVFVTRDSVAPGSDFVALAKSTGKIAGV